MQASQDGDRGVHLTAVPRAIGDEPEMWRACVAPIVHEGRMPWSGAKVTNHLLFALAGEHAAAHGCEEALMLDREGYLVEGSRSNVVVVDEQGDVVTPELSRGGVAGVGLEVLREGMPAIRERHVAGSELARAREIVAVNAVRGPRAVVSLSGRAVGDGRSGPVARRLAELFEAA